MSALLARTNDLGTNLVDPLTADSDGGVLDVAAQVVTSTPSAIATVGAVGITDVAGAVTVDIEF